MKFHICLDNDNILNYFFVSGFFDIKTKNFRKENILEPTSAEKGKTFY